MAAHGLPDDELRRRLKVIRVHGSQQKAAAVLGLTRSTIQHSIGEAARRGITEEAPDEIELPSFPPEDLPIEQVIDTMAARFRIKRESYDAHTWFPVKVKDKKPIGVMFFGDPHVDDSGCDWDQLKKHVEICRDTAGIYGVNIGDSSNNWAGRLVRLYANQDTSAKTARRLVEWLMLDGGVRWLVWLIGNHDQWGDGAEILMRMSKRHGTSRVICHDWEARFQLVFPGGWQPRIFAAHNFAGHSQWNPLHGPMKEGQMGMAADLYVAGDKHNWAMFQFENAARSVDQQFIRVRGYKFLDDHARHLGKHEQRSGSSILTIFDPERRSIHSYADVDTGADFLTWLRAR